MELIKIFNEPEVEVVIGNEEVVIQVSESGTPIQLTVGGTFVAWGDIVGNIADQTDLQTELDSKVPYTGATGNVTLGEYGLTTGYVQFDTTPTTYTPAVGNMGWNDSEGTIDLLLRGGIVSLPLGQKQVARVVNGTGGNVLKSNYQVVKVTGAQGQRLQVNLAQANNDANSADTLGLIAENINNNNAGFIITLGLVENINTTGNLQSETWVDGNVLYLSPTTPGAITNVKPQAPQHTVIVGFVVYAHPNNGKIFVKVDNGYEIDELHNVRINTGTLANGQVLKYNTSLSVWENGAASGVGTVTSITATSPLTGGTITSSGSIGIPQATGSVDGYLSSTDWTTFNSKQNALTNPITGTGVSGQVSYWNGTTTQTGSNNLFWDAANNRLGINTNSPTASLDNRGLVSITGTTASDGGQLGSELLSSANWTLNSGWTGDFTTGFAHSSGTATLTNTLAAVNGTYYLIAYTVTGRTAGTFTIAFGGTTTSGITATGSTGPRATSTGTLVITPTTDFNGTIVFSIKVISASSASIQLRNSAGTITNEIRNDSSNTNTLIGLNAGARNLGTNNTFIGSEAGANNTTGTNNTFVGQNAGNANTIGTLNCFFGIGAGQNNINGQENSFFGRHAGLNNIGSFNSFYGRNAGASNTTGILNHAFGRQAGLNNTTGGNNNFYGNDAGRFINAGTNLTVINNSVFLGNDTRALADSDTNEIVIGHSGRGLGSNTTVIGNTSTTFGRFYGNLLLGTDTNGGFLLDVNGTARVQSDATINGLTVGRGAGNVSSNTVVGGSSGGAITSGAFNSFTGFKSGFVTSSGSSNSFYGYEAGSSNTTTSQNSFFGANAGTVSTGSNNNFFGHVAGTNITSGSSNCLFGQASGRFVNSGSALTTLNNSVLIGQDTRVSANSDTNEIVIGYQGRGNGSNTTTIGNTSTTNNYIFGNFNVTDANNFVLGTTTGTKIGTATTQKLAFFNATPIVQPSAVTTTQGIADALTSLGLLASSTISGGGGGSVTSVSVVSTNGFAGTVANASTTPAITLTTTITGLLKGNGTAISSATANTDYLTPYTLSTKTSNFTETATGGEIVLLGDTTSAGFTITLPTAVSNTAKITIKKIAGSNNLTIDGNGSQTIDGGLTADLVSIYESVTLVSDNSNWHII
jgi:hypothetical protein